MAILRLDFVYHIVYGMGCSIPWVVVAGTVFLWGMPYARGYCLEDVGFVWTLMYATALVAQCLQALLNMACCCCFLLGQLIISQVFGELRVSEHQVLGKDLGQQLRLVSAGVKSLCLLILAASRLALPRSSVLLLPNACWPRPCTAGC